MPSKSKKKSILIIVAAIVIVIICGVALVPQLLSSDWGRNRVLNAAAANILGELSVERWALSWFGDQRLEGVQYEDDQAGVRATVPNVTISKGLAELLTDYLQVGTVTVTQPEVYFKLAAQSPEAQKKPDPQNTPSQAPAEEKPVPPDEPAETVPGLPPIQGRLIIADGTLYTVRPGVDPETEVKEISLELDATAAGQPLAYSLEMASADGAGHLEGKGEILLDRDLFPSPASIRPKGVLNIDNWEISRLLAIAAARGDLPSGSGLLGSQLTFEGDLEKGLQMNGRIDLTELQLWGGPLGEDRPDLDSVMVTLEAVQTAEKLTLKQLKLDSLLASGGISGDFSGPGDLRMAGIITVDLAATAEQIPATLRLKAGTRITGGTLVLDTGADYGGGENKFNAQARVEGLKGVSDAKEIAWEAPFIFDAQGKHGNGGLVLDRFSIRSAFMNGEGQGDLNDLSLTLDADLGAALAEISKFISLQGYSAGGKLGLEFNAKRRNDEEVGVSTTLQVENLAVRQHKKTIIPKHRFDAEFTTGGRLNPDFEFTGLGATHLKFKSWMGNGTFKGNGFDMAPDGALTALDDFTLQGDAKLKNLTLVLQTLGIMPKDTQLGGATRFDIAASSDRKHLNLEKVELAAEKFIFKQADKRFEEKRLTLTGTGSVNLGEKSATLAPVDLTTSAGKIQFATLGLDWKDPQNPAVRTRAAVEMDAGRLLAGASDFLELAPKTRLEGKLKMALETRPVQGGQEIELNSTVTPFRIKGAKGSLLADDSLGLDLSAQWQDNFKHFDIGRLTVKSSPLAFDAAGKVNVTGKYPRIEGSAKMKMQLGKMQKLLPLLPKALREQINGSKKWVAGGQVNADITVSGKDQNTPGFTLELDSPALSLKQGKKRLIPKTPLKIKAEGGLILDDNGAIVAAVDPNLIYDCWLGKGRAEATRWNMADNLAQGLNFAGGADLEKLATLLTALGAMDAGMKLSGTASTRIIGDLSPANLDLTEAAVEIKNLSIDQKGKIYRDQHLVINTSGKAGLAKRKISLKPLKITSSNGKFQFDSVELSDWRDAAGALKTKGGAQFELGAMSAALSDIVSLPPELDVAGNAKLEWNADTISGTQQQLKLKADLSAFKLVGPKISHFDEEQVAARLDIQRNPQAESMDVKQVSITSDLITVDAAGDLRQSSTGKNEITGRGKLGLDLKRAAAYIKAFSDIELEMAGTSERPFSLQISAPKGELKQWWKYANLQASFGADLIKAFGLEVRFLEVPARIENGSGSAVVTANLNQGMLTVQPIVDLLSNPPVLSIPENSRVLERMQVTPEMANELLAHIHPIFKGATVASGTIDLDLDYLSWPLPGEGAGDPEFAGGMYFHDVKLDTSPLIYTTLTALNVKERGMNLDERSVEFVLRNGRIECSPLKTNLGDTHILIGGSLGLDQTLDYLAQVPVTQHIVGKDLFEYLEGTTIRVPITGTLSKPEVSAKTVQATINDLAKQAGQKKLEEAAGNLLKKLFQ